MTLVATLLVGADHSHSLTRAVSEARAALAAAGGLVGQTRPLGPTATAIRFEGLDAASAYRSLDRLTTALPLDVHVQKADQSPKRLFLADMDSTMITVECIDEIADMVGVKDQVARITEAAMQGELDFEGALVERVALLKGLKAAALDRTYDQRITFTPGARTLVQTLAAQGVHTVLVSGGFTFFTERVAAALGFDDNYANRLEISDGRLTGQVIPPVFGPQSKLATLEAVMADRSIPPEAVLAVGDGANDIPMLTRAGLGVAYHAKAKARAAADAALDHADLTGLLYLLGIPHDQFVS
ncbi:phosphoserine phosphatase SerB [Rhodothalassium salexigens]|uniref:phosphoserine phosphatase SerB n=1 Tax=Rhodothalassium salexigens TaxID=1086 RepID=UPI001047A8E2|nr:phosphoserine phosphatase SerB [Rhodothalassium salexigens]MBB4212596.1 phosphoserine phosphatase [Rhodothalassium salexigens DSM 2132]MBK1639645.1 phosphoserine phosphatase SerB [Rhodothalassium salexigens DSM 2132]